MIERIWFVEVLVADKWIPAGGYLSEREAKRAVAEIESTEVRPARLISFVPEDPKNG